MASVNRVILIGNLGRDPESKTLPNGTAVCNFSIATTESWKDKTTGEKKENTEWHKITIFGKLAEIAGQYLKKGSQVYIEGKIKTRKWQDKDGSDRYSTEIEASELTMLGSKATAQESSSAPQQQYQQPRAAAQPATAPSFQDMGDDIPF